MKVLLAVLCVSAFGLATKVKPCSNAKALDDISERVSIGACNNPPCRLRKDTTVNVTLKFKPDEDVKSLKTSVTADILGIPFPFAGVDGVEACGDIFQSNGTPAGCDLKAGEEYVYKNKIEVLRIYPRLKTVVHWALTTPEGNDVICFEVPARITN